MILLLGLEEGHCTTSSKFPFPKTNFKSRNLMARNGFGFQLLQRFLAKLELLFEVEQYFEAKGRWRNGDDVSME